MRILMLDNEFPPLGGGMGTANKALFERWAALPDLEIDLITAALGKQREQERFADRIRIFKVPVENQNIHHSSNRELLRYTEGALRLAIRLQRHQPYDFCFAWSAVPAGAVALALRRLFDLPYMVWASGPDIPGFEQRYSTIYTLITPLLRRIWHGAEPLIVKCKGEIEMVQAVDPAVEPEVVFNGVDLRAFQPAAPVPDTGPLRLVCVARLIERKGQHHLIEAIKRLHDQGVDVVLDLIGTGDAQPANEAQAAALGVTERVRFVGYVPREELPQHLAQAHVFVLPSYNEGMSVAAVEGLAAGLPLVVTQTGGTEELVIPGVTGLTLEWGDVATLTAHLARLAEDRTLVRQMAQAARRHAENFNWDTIAEQYLELFDELLLRHGRPAGYAGQAANLPQ